MSIEEEFEKDLEKAIKWAAAEHKYFKKLVENLHKLKKNILEAHTETTVTGIKKALRIFKSLGRSEKRLEGYLKDAKKLSKDLKAEISVQRELPDRSHENFDKIIERIDVEAAHLIRDASRYEGELHKLLTHLDSLINEDDFEQAQQVIMQCLEVIEDAERWIAALVIDLNKAKEVAEEFSESYHEDIDGIKAVIAHLTDEAKIDYLINLLLNGKSLKRKTRTDTLELLKELIDHVWTCGGYRHSDKCGKKNLIIFANKIVKLELFEEAAKIYENESNKRKDLYKAAAENYEKAGNYKKAGEMWEKALFLFNAAKNFEKVKLFSKALSAYSKYVRYWFIDRSPRDVRNDYYYRKNLEQNLLISFDKAIYLSGKLFMHEEKVKLLINQAKYYLFLSGRAPSRISPKRKVLKSLKKAGFSKVEAWKQIGDWYDNDSNKPKAQAYENAGEWILASKEWRKAGDNKKAERAIQKSTKHSKDGRNNLLIQEADILFEQGQYVEALERYQKAEAWDKVGDCYNKLGKGVLAIRMYKKAVTEFEKKFGLKTIEDFKPGRLEEFNLSDTIKAQQISKNLPNAASGRELNKVLDVIIPLIDAEFDALTTIFYMKKSEMVKDTHWRKLAENLSTLGHHLYSAECYKLAGKPQDIMKAIEEYKEFRKKMFE